MLQHRTKVINTNISRILTSTRQAISIGLSIGLVTFYVIYSIIPSASSPKEQSLHLTWALMLQNLVYLSSLNGIMYPGAGWMDHRIGDGKPQLYGFPVLVGLTWVEWFLETSRLGRAEVKRA